jgi:hypothetical protein
MGARERRKRKRAAETYVYPQTRVYFRQRKPHSNGYPKGDPTRSSTDPPNLGQRASRDQTRCPHGQA